MSYSLVTKCFECEKANKCIDRYILDNAIGCIHIIGSERGHLGSGSIELDCQNLEQIRKEGK